MRLLSISRTGGRPAAASTRCGPSELWPLDLPLVVKFLRPRGCPSFFSGENYRAVITTALCRGTMDLAPSDHFGLRVT